MNWSGIHIRIAAVVALVAAGVAVALLIQHDKTQKGPITGSGTSVTEYRSVPQFTGVEVLGTNNVEIHVGRPQTVAVSADHNLVSLVSTTVEAGRLVIREPSNFTTSTPMTVEITVPSLNAVTLGGDGQVAVDGVKSETLAADLTGTGTVVVSGSVNRLTSTLAGTGYIDLARLTSWDAFATLSGDGRILVNAAHALHARLPGTGAIHYVGSPAFVDENVTGTGVVGPASES
jgi:hypothetical protein